jgi:hypothetical protein
VAKSASNPARTSRGAIAWPPARIARGLASRAPIASGRSTDTSMIAKASVVL